MENQELESEVSVRMILKVGAYTMTLMKNTRERWWLIQ